MSLCMLYSHASPQRQIVPAFAGAAAGAAASQFARQVITGSDVARPPLAPSAASLTPQILQLLRAFFASKHRS